MAILRWPSWKASTNDYRANRLPVPLWMMPNESLYSLQNFVSILKRRRQRGGISCSISKQLADFDRSSAPRIPNFRPNHAARSDCEQPPFPLTGLLAQELQHLLRISTAV